MSVSTPTHCQTGATRSFTSFTVGTAKLGACRHAPRGALQSPPTAWAPRPPPAG
jgi:hypothetical protein